MVALLENVRDQQSQWDASSENPECLKTFLFFCELPWQLSHALPWHLVQISTGAQGTHSAGSGDSPTFHLVLPAGQVSLIQWKLSMVSSQQLLDRLPGTGWFSSGYKWWSNSFNFSLGQIYAYISLSFITNKIHETVCESHTGLHEHLFCKGHPSLLNNGPCKMVITVTDAKNGQYFPSFKFDWTESTHTDSPSRYDRTHVASHRDDTVAH